MFLERYVKVAMVSYDDKWKANTGAEESESNMWMTCESARENVKGREPNPTSSAVMQDRNWVESLTFLRLIIGEDVRNHGGACQVRWNDRTKEKKERMKPKHVPMNAIASQEGGEKD